MDYLELIWLSVVVFTATNVDDIVILLAFFADPRIRLGHIALGQYLGIAVLVVVSAIASLISIVIPPAYIGVLGILPIIIGLMKLWELREVDDQDVSVAIPLRRGISNALSVAGITIANGGDNIAVYTPMFATRTWFDTLLISGVFAVMIAVWLVTAHWLVNHPSLGVPIRRYGRVLTPIVLIALGVLILIESRALQLLS